MGHPLGVQPERGEVLVLLRGSWLGEDGLPHPEANHHQELFGGEEVHPRRHLQHLGRKRLDRLPRGLERLGRTTQHRGCIGQEAVVVAEVHRVVAGCSGLAEISLVGFDRPAVGFGSIGISPNPLEDVRWHVDQVACRGHQRFQPLCRGHGSLGGPGGLHRVDVIVVGAGMVRRAAQDGLERGHDLLRAGRLLSVQRPESPGGHVHQRLGEDDLQVVVGRMGAGHLAHRFGEGDIQRALLLRGERLRPAVALGQRGDQLPLGAVAPAGRKQLRLLQPVPGCLGTLGEHRNVVVGSQGPGHAPEAGSAARVQLGGTGEGAGGLVMVEAKGQPEPLIEKGLGFGGGGGDGTVERSQAVEELGPFGQRDGRRGNRRADWGWCRGGDLRRASR